MTAERMAVAARVSGDLEESKFWTHLPATLSSVRSIFNAITAAHKATPAPAGSQQLPPAPSLATAPSTNEASQHDAAADVDGGDLDVDGYDRLVQQALAGPPGSVSSRGNTPKPSADAGTPFAARKSSLVPGHVLYTGPGQYVNSAIKQVAAGG
eukprot:jgi/Chrzof1/9961/Cz04g22020.t1